jgi:hypothetical protein
MGDAPRVLISARVDPSTKTTLTDEAASRKVSLGVLLDSLASRLRANRERRRP